MGQKLGQHFLANKGVVEKIVKAASLERGGVVLEIGPGKGALTFALAPRVSNVIAVEKDRGLTETLRKELARRSITNVRILAEDIRDFLARGLEPARTPYSVVANIPYYLTSALIRSLLEAQSRPDKIILMIQKEVAQRIAAKDGKESVLSLSVKFYAEPRILFYVSKGSFAPPPKVDSAIIEIIPHKNPPRVSPDAFFKVVKAGFAAPRKMLAGNLARGLGKSKKEVEATLGRLKIAPDVRPEKLALEQWQLLTKAIF